MHGAKKSEASESYFIGRANIAVTKIHRLVKTFDIFLFFLLYGACKNNKSSVCQRIEEVLLYFLVYLYSLFWIKMTSRLSIPPVWLWDLSSTLAILGSVYMIAVYPVHWDDTNFCPCKRNIPVHRDEVKWNLKRCLTRENLQKRKQKETTFVGMLFMRTKISFRFIDTSGVDNQDIPV